MSLKSHFKFNKQERSGIFFLLLLIILTQLGYFLFRTLPKSDARDSFSEDIELQAKIDILKEKAMQSNSFKIYPFNPNFITDHKGYTLGLSVDEIDRLHAFREQDQYVNSKEDFQKVTQISDSLLNAISPYFKFPEWTKNKKQLLVGRSGERNFSPPSKPLKETPTIADLNEVSAEELKGINGVGEVLSKRIIKFRDRLGGFLVEEQLYDVYHLEPDVVKKILTKYKVFNKPDIQKVNINTATAYEMSSIVYLKYKVAKEIVSYRNEKGAITSFDELLNIPDFPANKIDRIALYLSL